MKIISFAWTSDALLAGEKTCTRRDWKEAWARLFREGDDIQAYTLSPLYGGKRIAIIRLTCHPYQERTGQAPGADFEAEGLLWMERNDLLIRGQSPTYFWDRWRERNELVWVVRFELVSIEGVS